MTQKTISLPEELYEELKKRKRDNESFPQLIERLLNKEDRKIKIEELAGALEEDSKEWEEIEKMLYERRSRKSLPRGS